MFGRFRSDIRRARELWRGMLGAAEREHARVSRPPSKSEYLVGGSDTCWAFVSDSLEPRHLFDIVWAVEALRARGCAETHIRIYTPDPQVADVVLGSYGVSSRDLRNLRAELAQWGQYEVGVMIVGGHGTPSGIASNTLPPTALLGALRQIPLLQVGVAVLCQCYAGIFHLIDAQAAPPLALLGATNLNLSVSTSIRLQTPLRQRDGSDGASDWAANIFMFKFFEWIRRPNDVDGDGRVCLVDAFKHAGVESNQLLGGMKSQLFAQAIHRAEALRTLIQRQANKMHIDASTVLLQQTLAALHVHQEPWILHANLARSLRFSP